MALWMSSVKMPAWRPNLELLTSRSAWSKSENFDSTTAGPNASSQLTSAVAGTFSRIVASSIAPLRLPPQSTRAPASAALSIQPCKRLASPSEIIGPMNVSSSFGSPILSFFAAATYLSRTCSYTSSWISTRCTWMQLCPDW